MSAKLQHAHAVDTTTVPGARVRVRREADNTLSLLVEDGGRDARLTLTAAQ